MKHIQGALEQRQSLPLKAKIAMAKRRIKEWYHHYDGDVFVSFSGGKDSTVLLHLARTMYPDIKAMFLDTGVEYPEIRTFVRTWSNVDWVRPKKRFHQVVKDHGYPVVSKRVAQYIHEYRVGRALHGKAETATMKLRRTGVKPDGRSFRSGQIPAKWWFLVDAPFKVSHRCCYHLKKAPSKRYEKQTGLRPILGTMAAESGQRALTWRQQGCNSFTGRPVSAPLSVWTDTDIWEYLRKYDVAYCPLYDQGHTRTGCMFCAFGAQHPNNPKFKLLQAQHPRIYQHALDQLGLGPVLNAIGALPDPPSKVVGSGGDPPP